MEKAPPERKKVLMQFQSYSVKRLWGTLALLFHGVCDSVTEITVSWMQQTGGLLAMYDARSVANEIIRLAGDHPLTNMQLQKLVYIAHGYSLAILHRPLIRQAVEAWRFGPVIRDLYNSLRRFGAGYVTERIEKAPKERLSETDKALVASVLNAYGRFSGPQLSTMTHREGTPWREVFSPASYFHNDIIDDDRIRAHYTKLLNERAGINPA